ncbi:MAG: NnrU family protein [Steroidobacteraceae bacterium]
MQTLIIGLLIFLVAHSVSIFAPGWRERTAARVGEPAWKILYSLVSLLGFVLIVRGYASARATAPVIYLPPTGLRHAAALLLLPVFPLLVATYLRGRIAQATRHPTLVAVKLWAVAHLLANGSAADLVLFGSFLTWAVVDRIAMKSRPQSPRPLPAAATRNDVLAILIGVAIYLLFVLYLHQRWIGVAPLG